MDSFTDVALPESDEEREYNGITQRPKRFYDLHRWRRYMRPATKMPSIVGSDLRHACGHMRHIDAQRHLSNVAMRV